MKKLLLALSAAMALLAFSCGNTSSSDSGPVTPSGTPGLENPDKGSRVASLDFIFNNQTLGKTTIKIKRSEWNKLLEYYDYFFKNENCVVVEEYKYEKDGTTWKIPNVGFRLRGNTSRFRPQGKDSPTDEQGNLKPNAEWSSDYYNYAASCPDTDYRQAHFKVDFEEWLNDPDELKMAGCMKGVALKRMDPSCTREIMCYDLFHKFGIWTAPRASHTRLLIEFIEDDGTTTNVDFGVYEMFEEINKQSLKARDEDNLPKEYKNAWKNNKGNLWKISGGDLTTTTFGTSASVGVEDVRIKFDSDGNKDGVVTEFKNYDLKTNKTDLDKAKAELQGFINELNLLPTNADTDDNKNAIKAFYEKWFDIDFLIKTYAVNILVGMDDDYWANANNYYLYFDTGNKKATNKVYFIPFDYDNTLGNSIKKYPADGGNGDGFLQNPLEWGRGKNSPLIDKLLLVDEYKAKFAAALQEVSAEDSHWNFNKLSQQFLAWKDMVSPYLNSKDLKGNYISTTDWADQGGWTPSGYFLTRNPNIYDATRENILRWTKIFNSIEFDLNGGNINGNTSKQSVLNPDKAKKLSELISTPKKDGYIFMGWTKTKDGEDYQTYVATNCVYARWKALSEIHDLFIYEKTNSVTDGITVGILNVPSDAYVREFFVNGIKAGQTEATGNDDWNTNTKLYAVKSEEWQYPYTEAGNTYEIYIVYKNKWWGEIDRTKPVTIKAEGGKGAFKATTPPVYTLENNVFKFTTKPVLQIGSDKTITCPATAPAGWKNEWNECYICDIKKKGWGSVSWNKLDPSLPDLDLLTATNHSDDRIIPDDCRNTDLMFQLYFKYAPTGIEEYWLILHDFETEYFKVTTP